jgi:hypothetical protein
MRTKDSKTDKPCTLHSVSGSIIISDSNINGQVQITSNSKWFDIDDIIVLHDIDCIIIKRPTLDYRGLTHKLQRRCNTVQTKIMADIPLGRFEFDEESTEDELVIYYR